MSKAKLTIENKELAKFNSGVELAGLKILDQQNIGDVNQVQIYYKTEQQILMCGRYMEKIGNNVIQETEKKAEVKTPVKRKGKK